MYNIQFNCSQRQTICLENVDGVVLLTEKFIAVMPHYRTEWDIETCLRLNLVMLTAFEIRIFYNKIIGLSVIEISIIHVVYIEWGQVYYTMISTKLYSRYLSSKGIWPLK